MRNPRTSFVVPRGAPSGPRGGLGPRDPGDLWGLAGAKSGGARQCSPVQPAPPVLPAPQECSAVLVGELGTTKEVLERPRIYFSHRISLDFKDFPLDFLLDFDFGL